MRIVRRGVVGAVVVAAVLAVVAVLAVAASVHFKQPPANTAVGPPLPLQSAGSLALPGDSSRFDYASLDPSRHLLFIAHLGASEVIEVDTATKRVVRVVGHLDGVHGVLVVPALHRVFATATNTNEVITLDEDTGSVIGRAPTGAYPDGLAYEAEQGRIWITNESGGSQTVLDIATGKVVGTVNVGGDAGNVAYEPGNGTHPAEILVAVQSRNEVVVIDPATLTVVKRIRVPGCDHPHGLALDLHHRLGFIACDGNATMHTLDLSTMQIGGFWPVGDSPDVLALDPVTGWLYVAGEGGEVTIFGGQRPSLTPLGSAHLADGAHIVAVDPITHLSYYPIPSGSGGSPELLIRRPITSK